MKRVLFVSYHYLPKIHVSVFRIHRYMKYLPEFGWQPYILTSTESPDEEVGMITRIKDKGIISRVSATFTSNRSSYGNVLWHVLVKWIKKTLGKIYRRWLVFPDEQKKWADSIYTIAEELIKREEIDVVVTSAPPYSLHSLGRKLKKKIGVRWLADFRDNWTKNEKLKFPTLLHKNMQERLEYAVLSECDAITSVQPDLTSSEELRKKTVQILNGYDEEDFIGIQSEPAFNDKMIISYVGSFYGNRSPKFFLEGYKEFIRKYPEASERVTFKHYGTSHDFDIQKYLKVNRMSESVFCEGAVNHERALQVMLSSDVLLLVIAKTRGHNTVYTGKFFEYLRANKRILALVQNDSEVADILTRIGDNFIAEPDDASQICETIKRVFDDWSAGNPVEHLGGIRVFEARQLTGQLACVLDALIR